MCRFVPPVCCLDSRFLLRRRRRRGGFTLIEVLLVAVILLIGVTAVFLTTRSAMQRMATARELTEAHNACLVLLHELLAQSAPIEPHEGRTVEHLPHWHIRVDIYPAPQPGLYILHLSARNIAPNGPLLAARSHLLRWVPEERIRLPEPSQPTSVPFFGSEFDNLFY